MGQLRWKPQFEQLCINNLGKCHNLKESIRIWNTLGNGTENFQLFRNSFLSFPLIPSLFIPHKALATFKTLGKRWKLGSCLIKRKQSCKWWRPQLGGSQIVWFKSFIMQMRKWRPRDIMWFSQVTGYIIFCLSGTQSTSRVQVSDVVHSSSHTTTAH